MHLLLSPGSAPLGMHARGGCWPPQAGDRSPEESCFYNMSAALCSQDMTGGERGDTEGHRGTPRDT